ncbi:MAG: sensor histidine kinase [Actinomycetota bacterium]|nr:sensor histidine kinase [Actinomycetota bacterium]
MGTTEQQLDWHGDAFRHEALFYAGDRDYVRHTVPFIDAGVANGEPVLVLVPASKLALLREHVPTPAPGVVFGDVERIGRNPNCIIAVFDRFVAEHARDGQRARGIGEPIWASRTPAELVECQRHEELINLAFAGANEVWILCPFDTDALDESVIAEAHRSHPWVTGEQMAQRSAEYVDPISAYDAPLAEPAVPTDTFAFDRASLGHLRQVVTARAVAHVDAAGVDEIVLAVSEFATNSIRHGGGRGSVRIWTEGTAFVCEIHDDGRITDPMIGRRRPAAEGIGGRGVWLVNHLCDLVQIRSADSGTVVRLTFGTVEPT